MVLKTVLKVDIPCEKCKVQILKAVSCLQGVDKIEVDGEKGTLTVIGDVDPYAVVLVTRKKAGKFAQFVTVGPPPKPDEKKADEKKPDGPKCGPCPCPGLMCSGCWVCRPVGPAMYMDYYYQDPAPPCSIM